jgi:hypothetical protein
MHSILRLLANRLDAAGALLYLKPVIRGPARPHARTRLSAFSVNNNARPLFVRVAQAGGELMTVEKHFALENVKS